MTRLDVTQETEEWAESSAPAWIRGFRFPKQRRVTNTRGDFSSFSLSSAGMFLSNVVENIKLEGVEPQSASPKNWKTRFLYLLLVAALPSKLERWMAPG